MREKIVFGLVVLFLIMPIISAGVGLKWDKESALVEENTKVCLTYSVYNPWPKDSYARIELSEELQRILVTQEAETKLIPANTDSANAIPIEFCFKTPKVYEKDCWAGDFFVCEKKCTEEQVVYAGEVLVKTVPPPIEMSGTGGSTTSMAVSAPLRVKIDCKPYERDYRMLYALIAVLSCLAILWIIYKKYSKPAILRDKEKLRELKKKIEKEEGKKQKK